MKPIQSTAVFNAKPRRLFIVAAGAMFSFGMMAGLLGTLFGLPEMRTRLSIDLAQQGALFSLLAVGLLLASLLVGPVIERWGSKAVLIAGAFGMAAALLAFAVARGFVAASGAALVLGFGGGWLNAAGNSLISDVYAEERGRMLNLVGIFFGVGALFVPLIVAIGFHVLSIPGTMVICTAVALLSAVASATTPFPPHHAASHFSFREFLAAARHPGVAILALLLFFQGGNEIAFSGWTSTYLGSIGWSPRTATTVLLGYWVMAILGRMLSSRMQAWLGKGRLVLLSALLATIGCLILLVPTPSLVIVTTGAWLTALALSSIFPTTLAIAGDRYRGGAGNVFGVLFTVANLGTIVAPWLLGQVSQGFGVRVGMAVPLGGTVAVVLCAWLMEKQERG